MSTTKVSVHTCVCLTLIVLLVYFAGYPVLWAISDKEDEGTMQVIFNSVKKQCPNGTINVVMTDNCKD